LRNFKEAPRLRALARDKSLVLVVERDPHVRELQTHFLEQAGYAVEAATDGLVALAQAIVIQPDLVITEVLVSKLDGLALCRQLKANPATRNIPVLVFSILAASTRATEAGADAFLLKPLAKERLLSVVHTLVHERSLAMSQEQS
jgi:CheY-like chemotaxis protein